VDSSGVRANNLDWVDVATSRYSPAGEMAAAEIFSSPYRQRQFLGSYVETHFQKIAF